MFWNQVKENVGLWMFTYISSRSGKYHKYLRTKYTLLNWFYGNTYYFLDIIVVCTEVFHALYFFKVRLNYSSKILNNILILLFPGLFLKGYVGV